MYFCNMIGKDYMKSYNNGTVTISKEDVCEGFLALTKDNKVVNADINSTDFNLFLSGLEVEADKLGSTYRVGKPTGRKGNITYKMIQDTEENPLIIVLCKEIALFEGIEADLKVISLDDDCILACLVSGACAFDGTPMQRCNNVNLYNKNTIKFNSSQFNDFLAKLCTDKDSGYVYNKDVLCSVCIVMDSLTNYTAKKLSQDIIIDSTGLDNAKKIVEERNAKALALEQKRQEERQRHIEELKEREEQRIQEESKREAVNALEEASVGAASFLQAVAALSGGN